MSEAVRMQEFSPAEPLQTSTAAAIVRQVRDLIAALPELEVTTARTAYSIEEMLRARASRERFFNARLFADPAWDMLLELYAADCAQRRVSVSSLAVAARVPLTTALRWMDTLRKEKLVERSKDPLDGRRVYVRLSERGQQAMKNYFDSLPLGLRPL